MQLNESLEEVNQSIGETFNFRGSQFVAAHKNQTPKYVLAQIQLKLKQCLTEDIPQIRNWTFALAESIFGLLIFASLVTRAKKPSSTTSSSSFVVGTEQRPVEETQPSTCLGMHIIPVVPVDF